MSQRKSRTASSGTKQQVRVTAQIAGHAAADLESTRRLSLSERAGALATACHAAAALEASRRQAGLPDPVPAPWPQSTWEFLAKHARS